MIIHILSHVHFQTALICWWSKVTTFETQTFGQEIEPQQFQHTDGKLFWMKDMFVGWLCAALSWWFLFVALHPCPLGSHYVAPGIFPDQWPPTAGRREWRSCRRMFGSQSVLDQGSLNCLLGGIKQCKCMANMRDFHGTVRRLGW